MKVRVIQQGDRTFTYDADADGIRAAVQGLAPGERVRGELYDITDLDRSDMDADEYLIVTEDDGTPVWSGWLGGVQRPAPGSDIAALQAENADLRRLYDIAEQSRADLASQIERFGRPITLTPAGVTVSMGPTAHTWTAACAGHHALSEPCPQPGDVTRWRVRNAIVEAVQWTGGNAAEVAGFAKAEFHGSHFDVLEDEDRANCDDPDATAQLFDLVHSRWKLVKPDDWIVRGVTGALFAVADEKFRADYEAAGTAGDGQQAAGLAVRFRFADIDIRATCECGWTGTGDSAQDAFSAWWKHRHDAHPDAE